MPPKKDDKKKGGAGPYIPKVVDATQYIRKMVPLPTPDPEKTQPMHRASGKIINIETLFPEWSSDEVWTEPIPPEKIPKISYPSVLGVAGSTTISQYYNLAADEAADPKKKKDKKPPPKGASVAEFEFSEQLVNEEGKPLPVIFRDDESGTSFLHYPGLRPFQKRRRANGTEEEEETAAGEDAEDFVDPLLCDSFRIISEFAPRIVHDHGCVVGSSPRAVHEMDSNYLWRAIYPRLPSGKPCYNPNGKYCVKLFLAGRWRKVYVDDSLPLTSTGEIAVASSSDPLELWPILLSKAIYTVYTACGYSFADTLHAAEQATSPVGRAVQAVTQAQPGQQSCQLLSFALHLVTGWQPHHTTDASDLFLGEMSKALKLLKAMHAAGVPSVQGSDIVGPEDMLRFRLSSDPTASATTAAAPTDDASPVSPDQAAAPTVMTKWKFKEEYLRRRAERQEIVDAILSREKKIDTVSRLVQSSKREVYCLAAFCPSRRRYVLSPILALSFADGDASLLDVDNMLDTRVLLDWHRYAAVDVQPATNDPIILGRGQVPVAEFLQPFPQASPLRAQWRRLGDLVEEGLYLTALFTFTHVDHQADWSCHWQPLPSAAAAEAAAAAAKDAGKKKAKDGAPPLAATEPEVCASTGLPPPTFLALHTGQLFDQRASRARLEIQEAVAAQESAMRRSVSQDLGDDPIAFFDVPPAGGEDAGDGEAEAVSLTITLHADMPADGEASANPAQPPAPPGDASPPSRPASRAMGQRQASWDAACVTQRRVLASDVILVVQEVRTDDVAPLVFVAKLASSSLFPAASKTFSVPKHRLPQDPKQPVLFWMRLFTKASVFVSVRTTVPAEIGLAEDLWPAGTGWHAMVFEGDAQPTVEDTEQLLFRLPLVLAPHSRAVEASAASTAGASALLTPPGPPPTGALVFFHVPDAALEASNHLLLVSHRHGQSLGAEVLPELQGQPLDLSQKDGHGEMLLGYAHCRDTSTGTQLPAFHWKLVVLSQLPLNPPERPVQEVAVSQRYRGRYFPNNRLRLFRDVLTVDKASFPLALKLSVQLLDAWPELDQFQVPIVLRLYAAGAEATAKPVAQYNGHDVLHVYYQTLTGFLKDAGDTATATAAAAVSTPTAAAAAAKKGGDKKGAVAAVDTVDVVLDCLLDVEHPDMLPEGIFSRFPHVFDDLFEKNIAEEDARPGVLAHKDCLAQQTQFLAIKPPSRALLSWELDVCAGRVVQSQHDVSSLARFAAVKNAWEEKSAGEAERAQAALAYMREKLKVVDIGRYAKPSEVAVDLQALDSDDKAVKPPPLAPPRPVVELTSAMAESVATALNGEVEDLQARFQRLHGLPPLENNIELITPETNDEALKESLVNPYNLMGEIGSDPWMQAAQSRRIDNKQRNEAFYERIRARAIEFSAAYRSDLSHRIHQLHDLHKKQRLELAEAWNPREVYRLETEAKNTALDYVLRRAREARQVAKEKEDAAALEQQKLEAKKAKKK